MGSERPQVEASKLARGLGAVLERVVAGETIEIIRYGRVVAVLAPPVRRELVRPDTARPVQPQVRKADPLDAVSPQAQPKTGVGKITPQTRQQYVDGLLKGSRGKPGE